MKVFLESIVQRCSIEKVVRKNFAIFTERHPCWSQCWPKACNFIKTETPVKVFFCKYFSEHLFSRTSANGCFCRCPVGILQWHIFQFAIYIFYLQYCNNAILTLEIQVYIEFPYVNFKKHHCPQFNWEVKFLSLLRIRPIFKSSPLHLFVLQHLSNIWSNFSLHNCLSLCCFTCSL